MMHGDAGIRTSQFFRFVENPKGSYRDDRWLFEGLLLKMGIYVHPGTGVLCTWYLV